MSAWQVIIAAAFVVAGVAFVYWPAALIVAGALLAADGIFDLRGDS